MDNEQPLEDLARMLHGLKPEESVSVARMSSVRRFYLEVGLQDFHTGLLKPFSAQRLYKQPYYRKAYTMSVAALKRSIEIPSDETPRPVPLLEREERQAAQKHRLKGLDVEVGSTLSEKKVH